MRSKFQLNEGEVKRILNLHRNAILKETKQIIEEADTVSIKTDTVEFDQKGDYFGDQLKLFKGTTFKPAEKIPNSLVTTKKVNAQFIQTGALGRTYGRGNTAYVVYNCKTKNFYLIGVTDENLKDRKDYNQEKSAVWTSGGNMKSLDELCTRIPDPTLRDEVVVDSEKVDKCKLRKPKTQTGPGYTANVSWFFNGDGKCEYGQGSTGFSSQKECENTCVKSKKTKDDDNKVIDDTDPNNDNFFDGDEENIRRGESGRDRKRGCENRHKTIECSSTQKKCDTNSIRAQALINCKCPSNVLDAVLRGFPRGRTGNVGNYVLKEDGIWGDGSKAAWETCEDLIRSGSSGYDENNDDENNNREKDKGVKDDKDVIDDKNRNFTPTPKDLRLTPEEFAKLIGQ